MGHRSTQTQEGKTEDESLGSVIRVDEAEVRSHPEQVFLGAKLSLS
jgi:hypothetical protein